MKNFIKSVTLRLSQNEANYLQNGINAKYFMDIMSELHVCFKYDEETNEPDLIYAPTTFFNLYELAARWNMTPESVVAVVIDLKENGLLHFTLTDDELSIEPEIATFVSGDNLTFRGAAIGVDYLGERAEYHEKSFIHMEPSDYNLTMSAEYRGFLNLIYGIKEDSW